MEGLILDCGRSNTQLMGDSLGGMRHSRRAIPIEIAAFICLLSAIVACLGAVTQNSCVVRTNTVVRDSSVGPLALGTLFKDVLSRCRVIRDTVVPNYDFAEVQRVLIVDLGLDTVTVGGSVSPLNSDQTGQRIARIYVDRPILLTKDSLRVGMTLRELRRYRGLSGGVSEASTWLSVPGHCGIGLAISNSGPFEHGADMDSRALLRIADTTHVVRLEVSGCTS